MGQSYETILFEVDNHIATVTLNRPERMNAWNDDMARELRHVMVRCDEDDEVRAVVLTGAGRAFCAGADLGRGSGTFERRRGGDSVEDLETLARQYGGYAGPFPFQIRKPVLAAINGHAIGVGITYPMTCDVRIVAEDAKVQFAFVRRGVIPELWSHRIVAQVAGLSNAADLLMTGRMVSGRELAEMGLASAALPADQVLEATQARARETLLAAPVSVAITKRLLWEGLNQSFNELGEREGKLFGWTGRQSDSKEGVVSFLEKRDPDWKMSAKNDLPDM
ncbi:MAG: enoyl-CoA hydratase-related protein [Myxococcales bacterium]|nr:enoyl-CoA hydratase-related protein [Myxococcales bacterium]